MGEAKKRGTYEDRKSASISKREAREISFEAAQAERRRRLNEERALADTIRPKASPKRKRMHPVLYAGLALAAASMNRY